MEGKGELFDDEIPIISWSSIMTSSDSGFNLKSWSKLVVEVVKLSLCRINKLAMPEPPPLKVIGREGNLTCTGEGVALYDCGRAPLFHCVC